MSNRHQALEYSEQYTMNHTNEATKANEATNAQALSNTQRSNECNLNLLYLCYDRNL